MKPYNINDVADYVILSLNSDESFSLINLKLQKLMYYIQAWSLGINKVPFMKAHFEAWVHGPVCRQLYDRFKASKNLYSFIGTDDILNRNVADILAKEDKEFVSYILENYARYSGSQLEQMTHNEQPWIEARRGLAPMEHCENEITNASMEVYYAKRYAEIPD